MEEALKKANKGYELRERSDGTLEIYKDSKLILTVNTDKKYLFVHS